MAESVKLLSLHGYSEMSKSAWVRILTDPNWNFFISLLYTFSDVLVSVNDPRPKYLLTFAKSSADNIILSSSGIV